MGIGVYRCSKCHESYTTKEYGKLRESKKARKCKKCSGDVNEITPSKGKGVLAGTFDLKFSELHSGVERFYYRILTDLNTEPLDYDVEKTSDYYTASEASDFWSDLERRKTAQADQAMKYIASIGSMIKSLFQVIRELRHIDQRLKHYDGRAEDNEDDDVVLKGLWIDKVEGGAQKPTSIYAMGMQLGFATLPDLFFKLRPKTKKDVNKYVDALKGEGINRKVREVVKRKLSEFMNWLEETERELRDGRKFKLAYLKQHFHVIRMYLDWVKPYIRNVESLNILFTHGQSVRARTDMIRAAESAVIDLELFAQKGKDYSKTGDAKDYYKKCLRIKFHYATVPQMVYSKQYQRGPAHTGKTFINFEAYALNDEEIKKYKQHNAEEDIELLKAVNSAIEGIEDELLKYLAEADDEYAKKKLKEKEGKGKSAKKAKGLLRKLFETKKKRPSKYDRVRMLKSVGGGASKDLWQLYDKFKKNFGMVRW